VSLAGAVIVIGLLSALVRPVLLALVAPFSPVLVLLASLAFQVLVLLAVAPIVPGFEITGATDAFIASWVFAIISSLASWLLSLDSDESYYAMLVRRLISRREDVVQSDEPGLVVIQIDGLAHAVLLAQVRAGRVPVISRWLRRDGMSLAPWATLLPSQTSASQAGILFGTNDDIPAFRWWNKNEQRLFVSNHVADAERLEERLSANPGLLENGGASIGNLLSGGAVRSYLTLATTRDPASGLGHSRAYYSFFVSPYGYVHAIVLGIAEVLKELFQARRAQLAGVQPHLARHFPYPLVRALLNVVLRPVSTSLVVEEMLRGTPIIYVTYADYDEIAHYSGPQRAESLDALDGIDRALGSLARAAEDAPRPYHFVVLSDHGQSLGATFRQRFGRPLEQVVRQLMGGPESVVDATREDGQWRIVNTFLSEVAKSPGATGAATRRLLSDRMSDGVVDIKPGHAPTARAEAVAARPPDVEPAVEIPPELAVCPSGNLALVYFPRIAGGATLEQLEERYPGMVDALTNHPGIGLLMVRSAARGPMVASSSGVRYLDDGRIEGADPLAPYGPHSELALKRVHAMDNCGDLVVISLFDQEHGEVAAFEELIGSHGGLGGPQTDAFILYPADWSIDEPIIGAPAVNRQLRSWMGALQRSHRPTDAR
jgi:uncharacterized membrane protein YvlD (DUF360 family)